MEIDYDLLAQKIKESLAEAQPKKLTGRAYFRALRKEKNKLEENYIAPESGAPLVSMDDYENLMAKGLNWSVREREAIRITLANIQRNKGNK